jgi:hypothetical protein
MVLSEDKMGSKNNCFPRNTFDTALSFLGLNAIKISAPIQIVRMPDLKKKWYLWLVFDFKKKTFWNTATKQNQIDYSRTFLKEEPMNCHF